jgi:hypothetical protein
MLALCGSPVLASEQIFVDENGEHVTAEVPTEAELQEALNTTPVDEDSKRWGDVWHCTAYPEDHGHFGVGYSYADSHYSQTRTVSYKLKRKIKKQPDFNRLLLR